MKHFSLKFNHGVEIGAFLAYTGHNKRVPSKEIESILQDELHHKEQIKNFLTELGEKPNPVIDFCFTLIGNLILILCTVCPIWSLDLVASTMEIFAVFNYRRLSKIYPQKEEMFIKMAECEDRHQAFFSGKDVVLPLIK